jgi:hypothetical protein
MNSTKRRTRADWIGASFTGSRRLRSNPQTRSLTSHFRSIPSN